MTESQYLSVIHTMRLPSGIPFPIPITLDVSVTFSVSTGDCVELLDVYSNPVAKFLVSDIFRPNRTLEALLCYGNSTDISHPAVEYLLVHSEPVYLGGDLIIDRGVFVVDYPDLRLSPTQVKREIAQRGANTVIAFQTRNPLHAAHVEMIIASLSRENLVPPVVLLLHPVVGPTKSDDVPYPVRVETYLALLARGSLAPFASPIILALLPLAMRFGGPREAVLHMLIRKNFGATHFIVGRDHAGCNDFYDPLAAIQLANHFAAELGIAVLNFPPSPISGSKIRKSLAAGEPVESADPVVVKILQKIYPPLSLRGLVILIVGLSGSGKTTLALALQNVIELHSVAHRRISLLDGDAMRKTLSPNLGFSKQDRIEHLNRILFLAKEISNQRGVVIVSTIAPYRIIREKSRREISANFVLVHVNTSVAECANRDTKGLYHKAALGQMPTLSGVHAEYEPPSLEEATLTFTGTGGRSEVSNMAFNTINHLIQNKFIEMDENYMHALSVDYSNQQEQFHQVESGVFGTSSFSVSFLDDKSGLVIDVVAAVPYQCIITNRSATDSVQFNMIANQSVADSVQFNMIVEVPKHTRAKIEYRNGFFVHDRFLAATMPVNYGFIPQTRAGDGDPLDAIEIGSRQLKMGQSLCVHVLGILWFTDNGKDDHKILVSQLPQSERPMETIRDWFLTYKGLEGGKMNLQELSSGPDAMDLILASHENWKNHQRSGEL